MLTLWISSAHRKHTRYATIFYIFYKSFSPVVKFQILTELCLCGFLWYKAVVFLFYWLHFLYSHRFKNLYDFFWIKHNWLSKVFMLLISETFCIHKIYCYCFTQDKEIFAVLLHSISPNCQFSIQANMYDRSHTALCENTSW